VRRARTCGETHDPSARLQRELDFTGLHEVAHLAGRSAGVAPQVSNPWLRRIMALFTVRDRNQPGDASIVAMPSKS
jgi:hypothetical protein